jgi:GNAT superfamily N-acetyltransferase
MPLIFAAATQRQHDEIADILRAAFTPYARLVGHELTADAYDWLRPAIDAGRVHVGLYGAKVAGTIVTARKGDDLKIEFVATDPGRQGSGVGSWLIAQIEEFARRDRISALILHTAEIREDLLRFYRRHGFVETHRALPAHGRDVHLRVHMRKEIVRPEA